MSKAKHHVYALMCPLTSTVGYVGVSKNAGERFFQHIAIAKKGNSCPQYKWIASLLKKKVVPSLVILQQTTFENRQRHELEWINRVHDQGLGNRHFETWYRKFVVHNYRWFSKENWAKWKAEASA